MDFLLKGGFLVGKVGPTLLPKRVKGGGLLISKKIMLMPISFVALVIIKTSNFPS
jgi:hypothetical protein